MGEELKTSIDPKTGLASPPITPCHYTQDLKCPYSIDTEAEFNGCDHDECRYLKRKLEKDRRIEQEKLI